MYIITYMYKKYIYKPFITSNKLCNFKVKVTDDTDDFPFCIFLIKYWQIIIIFNPADIKYGESFHWYIYIIIYNAWFKMEKMHLKIMFG